MKKYHYISGDSHLEIDSKHWINRVPGKFRDQAPRLVRQPDEQRQVDDRRQNLSTGRRC